MKRTKTQNSLLILLSLFIIGCLAYIITKDIENTPYPRNPTITQGKQLHQALMEHVQHNNGAFPKGNSQQEIIQNLITSGHLDTDFPHPSNWTIISGLTMTSKSSTPLLTSKMISLGKFNPTIHNNHAIIVTLDGAATAHKIQPDGTIHLTRSDDTPYNPFLKENLPPDTKILIP